MTQEKTYYDYAISKDVPTYEEDRRRCIKENLWSDEKDERIRHLTYELSKLRETKNKISKESSRAAFQKRINEVEKEYRSLDSDRTSIIGQNAESFSKKKVNEYYIFKSLYSDNKLTKLKFSEEEYDDIDPGSILDLTLIYNEAIKKFAGNMLKKVAISREFLSFFSICDDNPMTFYGKPVIDLTFYQVDLFSNGRYYKNAISEGKIRLPDDIDDPDALIEFIESSVTIRRTHENKVVKTGEGGYSIPGASKKDMEKLTEGDENVVDLTKEAKKKGGRLNYQDMLKLHGVKVK
tara:strand:+ start:127019 stop:127897 length:879 start_codon:yes stop_codon:yes gene_type:complete